MSPKKGRFLMITGFKINIAQMHVQVQLQSPPTKAVSFFKDTEKATLKHTSNYKRLARAILNKNTKAGVLTDRAQNCSGTARPWRQDWPEINLPPPANRHSTEVPKHCAVEKKFLVPKALGKLLEQRQENKT